MRVLWRKAPLVLFRHPPLLSAVVVIAALAALAAASSPLVRAGVESESLQGQLRQQTPLSAGLEIRVGGGRAEADLARRAAARRLARTLRFVGEPVLSSLVPAQLAGAADAGAGVDVVALARTGALAHVHRETASAGPGVWIADSIAKVAHLRPGGTLRLTEQAFGRRPGVVHLRVAGLYRSLERDLDNPYWANWLQDIRDPDPDAPPPPSFVLMSEGKLTRVARALSRVVENRFELPVDPHGLSFGRARDLDRRLDTLRLRIERPGSQVGRPLGCGASGCSTSSSLDSALIVAAGDVSAVTPTISLLAGIGIVLSLGLGAAVGVFLVRRRVDEVHVAFVRGERAASFAVRTALESLLPAVVGLALGLGAAMLALRLLAPAGTIDGGVVEAATWRAVAVVAAALAAIAVGAGAAFPHLAHPRAGLRGLLRVPWELVPLVVGAALLALVLAGRGLAHDATGTSHPRLAVFALPLVAVSGVAGVAVRVARRALGRRGGRAPTPLFLALRRLGAARSLLVAVAVAAATGFGAFCYAATVSASLARSTAEKAWVANGSDVQGFVDPNAVVPPGLSFPTAVVQVDQTGARLPTGEPVDLISGDPDALARTLRWGNRWPRDPRPLLPRLDDARAGRLAAIATPGAPDADAIIDQGVTVPITIVGRAAVPGSSAGRTALLVSRAALRGVARRARILDPAPQASGLIWAKGPPGVLVPALRSTTLQPVYLTTPEHIFTSASVAAARRSYRFVKLIGAAAAVLALIALLLYLQARQHSQSIASALARRMGLHPLADAAALAAESGLVVLFAALVGGVVATITAAPIARHVDSLPQYAPPPAFTVPWLTLAAGLVAAVAAAALLGAAAAMIAARSNVAEELRVA